MEILHITSESEMSVVVGKTLLLLKERAIENQASVLALSGTLGAGKTAFTKKLASALGVEEVVTSPTFVVMKQYDTKSDAEYSKLVHIDAYRIENIDEMRPLRFSEVLATPNALVCIEWAERVQELLPKHTVYLNIEIDTKNQDGRTITFS